MTKTYDPRRIDIEKIERIGNMIKFEIHYFQLGDYYYKVECEQLEKGVEARVIFVRCFPTVWVERRTEWPLVSDKMIGRNHGHAVARVLTEYNRGRIMSARMEKAVNDALK